MKSLTALALVLACESKVDSLTMKLRVEPTRAQATYVTSEGTTYTCETKPTIFDQSKSQNPQIIASLLFLDACQPNLTPDLVRTISRQMKVLIPVDRKKHATVDWIQHRTGQDCIVKR